MAVRVLAPLTLDAIRAESIALDLRMLRGQSPFDATLSGLHRLAGLSEQLGEIFKEATAQLGDKPNADPVVLSKNLITLAALAAAWAEVLDNYSNCTCFNKVDWKVTEGAVFSPCAVHPTRKVPASNVTVNWAEGSLSNEL